MTKDYCTGFSDSDEEMKSTGEPEESRVLDCRPKKRRIPVTNELQMSLEQLCIRDAASKRKTSNFKKKHCYTKAKIYSEGRSGNKTFRKLCNVLRAPFRTKVKDIKKTRPLNNTMKKKRALKKQRERKEFGKFESPKLISYRSEIFWNDQEAACAESQEP